MIRRILALIMVIVFYLSVFYFCHTKVKISQPSDLFDIFTKKIFEKENINTAFSISGIKDCIANCKTSLNLK